MARPISPEKRLAILDAATQVVATLGILAPTSQIAKKARVAEGTLFTYFKSKDELLNQLYIYLKTGLRETLMAGYPHEKGLMERARHFWDRSVALAMDEPVKRKALNQLAVSDLVTEKSRKICAEHFGGIKEMLDECGKRGSLKNLPPTFALGMMNAIIDATIASIEKEPGRAKVYAAAGFESFWKAVTT